MFWPVKLPDKNVEYTLLGLLPSDETFCSQAELNNCGGIDLAIWDSFGAKKDNLDAHFPFFADGVTFKVRGWLG